MDDPELFDVFNVDDASEPAQRAMQSLRRDKFNTSEKKEVKKSAKTETPVNGVQRKRSYDDAVPNGILQSTNGEDVSHISKRSRKREENPIVVDSFETESEQVVPATQGLQGIAPVDKNIVIKKRVSTLFPFCLMFSIVMQLYSPRQTGDIRDWNRINF